MSNREVVVVSGARTAIGDYGGALKDVRPDDMAAHIIHRPPGAWVTPGRRSG